MKIKYVLSLLRTLKIPGFFPLMKDWQALVRLHFIYAALESGLLEALRIPASREVLIRSVWNYSGNYVPCCQSKERSLWP